MKVVNLKAAAAAIERKRYGATVLECFDKQKHSEKREQAVKRSETQRKARNKF